MGDAGLSLLAPQLSNRRYPPIFPSAVSADQNGPSRGSYWPVELVPGPAAKVLTSPVRKVAALQSGNTDPGLIDTHPGAGCVGVLSLVHVRNLSSEEILC